MLVEERRKEAEELDTQKSINVTIPSNDYSWVTK